jgi:GNAT superfamily N-acetyltransferase
MEHRGQTISFRVETPDDEELVHAIYASTRADELARTPWDASQKEAFTRMQHLAQRTDYRRTYPSAIYAIVLLDESPAGRLYFYRTDEEIHVLDIALLPEFRNEGVGGAILNDLQREAVSSGRPLTIYVEKFNPALRLYTRLGFVPTDDAGLYLRMSWKPS